MQRVRKLVALSCVLALALTGLVVGGSPAAAAPPKPTPSGGATAKPATLPLSEEAAAMRQARQSGHRVEITGRRTGSTITYANPDGTLTSRLSAAPERVRTAKGWQDIDTTLVGDAGGVHPKVAVGAARLSPGGERALLQALLPGGQRFGLEWPVALPTPTLRGDTATYPGVVAGGDLELQALPGGVELSLVLRQRPAAGALGPVRLPLSGDATLRVAVDAARGGGLRVRDAAGNLLAAGPPPVMFGAARDRNGEPARSSALDMTVEPPSGAGERPALVLAPDPAFLADPGVAYPVRIDPVVSWLPASDTYVQASMPSDNFNGSTGLVTGTTNGGGDKARSLVTFDTTSLLGADIQSATLHVFNFQSAACTSSSANPLTVHQITGGWDPATVTWSSGAPPWSNTVSASSAHSYQGTTGCPGAYIDLNVTSVVAAWAGGAGNWGVMLRAQSEADNAGFRKFYSKDHAGARPSLEVTYIPNDAVRVQDPPRLVHANGAELEWTRYQGLSGVGFDRYEVHRGPTAGFTPSSSTLLTTIRDVDTTSWRDTSAAPSPSVTTTKTFYYKVVANTWVSNELNVPMPIADTARLSLQPDAEVGKATYLVRDRTTPSGCYDWYNYGAATNLRVGTAAGGEVHRPLLAFDVRDIPAKAAVSSATMTLWYPSSGAPTTTTGREIKLHRVTRAWTEGTGTYPGQCNGSGADWSETQGGVRWSTGGGDFDATADASVGPKSHSTANGQPGSDAFTVTSLVQEWVNATAPNHGVLLKLGDDQTIPTDNPWFDYYPDDAADPALRPKLTVTYSDASASVAPRVTVAAPAPGATVSGGTVPLKAAAADDGRVDMVEFLVDGAVVATDTAAPFATTWSSIGKPNGNHSVTARATDDAGNPPVTSAAVTVKVDNTALPAGSLTAPAAGATVAGSAVTLSASASDDAGVRQVDFLVDGLRVGAPDTSSPYSVAWNTLDPLARVFDGAHQVQAMVTDTSGQQVVTAAREVTVNNVGASQYSADFKLNDPATTTDDVVPPVMTETGSTTAPLQDPYAGTINPDGTSGGSLGRSITNAPNVDTTASSCPAEAYCPTVTITNTSGVAWKNSSGLDLRVWYRWYAPNGAILLEGPANDSFPNNFAPGAVKLFPLVIQPPRLPPGAELGQYRLRIDLYDLNTASWFAARGNSPVDHPVLVAKRLEDRLGLERFWHYDGEDAGAGMTTLANVANGNMLLRWTPLFAPGRGLATMVDLTYNSMEDHSPSPAGDNVSLAISGLIRFGEPLDIHPNKADDISNHSNNKFVELVDGDGTVHRFTGSTQPDGTTRWTEPPGVNLYLRSIDSNPDERHWALTRPDKVTFYFDVDGFPTAVVDRNGNTLSFTLEDTPAGEDPGGPKKRITRVTDAGGRAFTVDYWSKDEAKKAHVRGKVQRITDHDGSALDFDYYDDGNLLRLTQRGGTTAGGDFLSDRSFVFTYTTSSGAGPAITDPAARVDPDPKTANQSTRLFSVRDPRGAETTFAYFGPSDGAQLRWKLKSRTNRTGQQTTFGYDLPGRVTTVTAPLSRVTRYTYDTDGKVTQITNPLNQPTGVEWTPDFKVSKVTEPTGKFSSYTYNPNGYPLSQTNQAGERTELTYLDSAVDAADSGNHLSLLGTVTSPKGVATPTVPGDFQWRFTYDSAGNPDKVTDPTGAVTDDDYNLAGSANPGTLTAVHDANGNPPTTFPSYDPSGQPTEIRDPLGNSTRFGYDPDGRLIWVQDPNHAADTGTDERSYKTFFDYDAFGRLGQQSAPKSTRLERGRLLWSGADYDPNDNLLRQTDPHYGPASGDPGNGPASTTTYDPMDQPTELANQDSERSGLVWDAAGRLSKQTAPKGMASTTIDDYTTLVDYDPLDRVVRQTQYGTSTSDKRITHMCYDTAGDLRSVTAPRAALDTVNCPGNGPLSGVGFTASFDYDPAHRRTASRDPLGHETRSTYDANGNAASTEQDITTGRIARSTVDYDQRDAPVTITQRLDGATNRTVVSRVEYDPNGNRSRMISPRGNDAAGGSAPFTNYVTAFAYDADNRLTRITLPFDSRDGTERQYLHRAYDAGGNLAWASLPVTSANAPSVQDTARTLVTYFDPGWIRTSDDPANPKVRFDYTAQGQQAERTPERKDAPGVLDTARRMTWAYFSDGPVKQRTDQGGQAATYAYDANNNLTSALNASGLTDPGEQPVDTQVSYTGFDEVAKARFRKQDAANWTFSDATYDADGNVSTRRNNGEEDTAGTQTKAPRSSQYTYDGADWLTQQLDLGTDGNCSGDQRITTSFWDSSWQKQRDVYRAGSGCSGDPTTWPKQQTTTWTQFDNGLAREQATSNGAGAVTESHQVGYTDDTGVFVNGNRTSDHYVLKRAQASTATTCLAASPCDAKYGYDARDRLTSHQLRAGKTNTYTYDQPAQLIGDTTIRAGNITTQVEGGVTTTRKYTGQQLTEQTSGGATGRYWYDPLGNLDCVTTAAGTQADCSPADGATPSANLVADNAYDYLNRLASIRSFAASTRTDTATYTYDALDRTTKEVEDHTGTANDRTTTNTFQGLSNLITQEQQSGGTDPKTKTYAYDAYGHRLSLTDTNTSTGATSTYSYGTDVHGSVSQLLDDAGNVKASYGYTAYGASDAPTADTESLTSGDPDPQAPLNPYRYSSRRMDSGTVPSSPTVASGAAGYDMGARRFGPDLGSFLQQDQFSGALADLGLALDPLTQNRYALAGGNPISYVEWDGHVALTLQQLENINAEPAVTEQPTSPKPSASDPNTQRLININTQPKTGQAPSGGQLNLTNIGLAAQIEHWGGSTEAHRAVQEELLRRLCPHRGITLGLLEGKCEKDLVLSNGQKADIALFKTGAVYEIKPDWPWRIPEARRQIAGYLELLNQSLEGGDPKYQTGLFSKGQKPAWHRGEQFEEFSMDYRGHRLLVKWEEPGIVTYRPDCDPNCDAELDINRPTIWHVFKSFLSIPAPGVTLDPVPVAP